MATIRIVVKGKLFQWQSVAFGATTVDGREIEVIGVSRKPLSLGNLC